MMYEGSIAVERGARNGLSLDFNDPKKVHARMDSQRTILTNGDFGKLELTSPELERIMFDPTLNGLFHHHHQQPQEQPGYGGGGNIVREPQDSQRSFDPSPDQLRRHVNLPKAAQDAVVSSDEDSDTESRQFDEHVQPPSTATSETGFPNEPYISMDSKFVSLQQAINTSVPMSVVTARARFNPRQGTLLPTAFNPGVSYLPFGTFQSIPPSRPKEEPMQMVPCLDGSPAPSLPPMSPINMDDQDRVKQERKRERNRLAARKCRTKKLEQIMLLEGRVKELKEQNRSLGDTAAGLRTLMNKLQMQISQHISCGCPMMTTTTTMPDSSPLLSPSSFAAQ